MDNYKTLKQIGKGGMAAVFLARSSTDNRLAAIKVLQGASTQDPEYIKRFFREARITAQLKHPNIIEVLESNYSHEKGFFYIVTAYMDGGNFHDLLYREDVSLRKKLQVLHKVLLALDHAHSHGIIHRDVKPSNILLTKNLEPRLCDFGIATALWGMESKLTRTNVVMGTMDYIAPEQKEDCRGVDHRADIYSMGVIFYQLITGSKPQGAFQAPGRLNPSIPEALDHLVMKCLQPVPTDRYKNAHNLAAELFRIIQTMGEETAPEPKTLPPSHVTGKNKLPRSGTEPNPVGNSQPESGTEIQLRPPGILPIKSELELLLDRMRKGGIAEKLTAKPQFLKTVGPEHLEQILELLPQAEGFLKETLIESLGKLKTKKSCPILIELLSDPYYNKVAAEAVGEVGCVEAEAKLFNILLTHNESAYTALVPLGKLNSIKSVDLIAQYLSNKHTWVRQLALDALALIRDPEGSSMGKIAGYLESISNNDSDANVRAKSKNLLRRLKQ